MPENLNLIMDMPASLREEMRRYWAERMREINSPYVHEPVNEPLVTTVEFDESQTMSMKPEQIVRFNNIFLQKKLSIMIPTNGSATNKLSAASLEQNVRSLGYSFKPSLFKKISTMGATNVQRLKAEIIPVLKGMSKKEYRESYEMSSSYTRMSDSTFQSYIQQQLQLWMGKDFEIRTVASAFAPDVTVEARPLTPEESELQFISLGALSTFEAIFTNILKQEESSSAFDRQIMREFIMNYGVGIDKLLPDEIPLKENIGLLGGLLLEHAKDAAPLGKYVKTTGDVFNIITALRDTVNKPFPRATKRWFLNELEQRDNLVKDVLDKQEDWKSLIPSLRPEDYKKRFPRTFMVFDAIQNSRPIDEINSNYELAILNRDVVQAASILKSKPELFASKLDSLLRANYTNYAKVLEDFIEVAPQLPVMTLFKLWHHFNVKCVDPGDVPLAKYTLLAALPDELCKAYTARLHTVLNAKLAAKPSLGRVFISEKLKDVFVPLIKPAVVQPLSEPLHTLVRGSKIQLLGNGETARIFLWWKNGNDRVDLDIGAFTLGTNWELLHFLNSANMNSFQATYSGDISSAPVGAAEYIDLSPYRTNKNGCRYVVYYIASPTKQPFNEIPDCYVGWEEISSYTATPNLARSKALNESHSWGANIQSNSRYCIPLVLDVVNRQIIWCDLPLSGPLVLQGKKPNFSPVVRICKNIANHFHKPNLYDLFKMHGQSRGTVIGNREFAQTIFAESNAYKVDEILGDYLGE